MTTNLESTKTEELLRLAEAATPGPWVCDWPIDSVAEPDEHPDVSVWQGVEFTGKFINNISFDNSIANGNFIALANPATILELCALLEKAEEALHKLYHNLADTDANEQAGEALAAIKQWKEQE